MRPNSFPFVKCLCVFWIQAATEGKYFQAYRHCGDMFISSVGLARCSLPESLVNATKNALFSGTRLLVWLCFTSVQLHKS